MTIRLPAELPGHRIKVEWPIHGRTFDLNISRFTEPDGRTWAVEVFSSTDSLAEGAMSTAVATLMSHILRHDSDPMSAIAKLKTVSGPDAAWIGGKSYRGIVSLIARRLEDDIRTLDVTPAAVTVAPMPVSAEPAIPKGTVGRERPSCGQPTLISAEGCDKWLCGYSRCS